MDIEFSDAGGGGKVGCYLGQSRRMEIDRGGWCTGKLGYRNTNYAGKLAYMSWFLWMNSICAGNSAQKSYLLPFSDFSTGVFRRQANSQSLYLFLEYFNRQRWQQQLGE